jgi:hypothetical protein
MKMKFPPPRRGRDRVGVILGIFSQLRERIGEVIRGKRLTTFRDSEHY